MVYTYSKIETGRVGIPRLTGWAGQKSGQNSHFFDKKLSFFFLFKFLETDYERLI